MATTGTFSSRTQSVRQQHIELALATVDFFLERETPEFISPLLWPPNSPYVNPVDYCSSVCVGSILQEKVYKTRITDHDDLKHRISQYRVDQVAGSRRHCCCSCASVTSSSFSLSHGGPRTVVTSSTAFNSHIVFFAVTAAFEFEAFI